MTANTVSPNPSSRERRPRTTPVGALFNGLAALAATTLTLAVLIPPTDLAVAQQALLS